MFKVGDKVRLATDEMVSSSLNLKQLQFYRRHQSKGRNGVVMGIREHDDEYPITVTWDNGHNNDYPLWAVMLDGDDVFYANILYVDKNKQIKNMNLHINARSDESMDEVNRKLEVALMSFKMGSILEVGEVQVHV